MNNSYISKLNEVFFQEMPAISIAWVRLVLYSSLVYLLLSRDFRVFAFAPDVVLNFYPSQQYKPASGYAALGCPTLVDLSTFHWVHWIFSIPNSDTLFLIQSIAILFCVLVLVLGRGPKNLFVIGAYIFISYLYGYVWRSGGDIESIFLMLQVALAFCFFRESEALIPRASMEVFEYSHSNGAQYSIVLLIFCSYYFYSGLNKLWDISPFGWFQYDLVQTIGNFKDMSDLGFYFAQAPLTSWLRDWTLLNYIGVPLVYIAEITCPIIFLYRKLIPYYVAFFALFHYLVWGVAVCFFGVLLMLSALLPIHRFSKVRGEHS